MSNVDDGLPPDEAKRLAAFVGEWTVVGSLALGMDRAMVSGQWRFEEAAGGWGVFGKMNTEIEGMGAFGENELIGFDEVGGNTHLFSMNRFTIRDHVGGWADEDTLVVQYVGIDEGKQVTEEITIEFVEPGRMVARVIEQAGGEIIITTDLIMERLA